MLHYLVEDGASPGIVLGLLEADGSTRVLTEGEPGPGVDWPLGSASVFEIGSVTKVFTGTLLADMVGRGEVALDDPVARYLPPEVSVPVRGGREITLLDLATHTSGLPGAPDHQPADPRNPWGDWTVERLYEWLGEHELAREPGAAYEYSNLGMGLLGHVLANAAGVELPELMRERVLSPLGMDGTGYGMAGEVTPGLVRGHEIADTVPHWTTTEAIWGAGGLRSTAEDLLRFIAANVGPADTDLQRAMREAHEPRRPGSGEQQVGLAWLNSGENGRRIVQHSGSSAGFRAHIAFDPERRVGVVLLANSGTYRETLALDLVSGRLPPWQPQVDPDPGVLADYPGEYESAGGLPLHVALDDEGHLTGQAPNQIRFRLYATSDSSFYARRVPFTMAFVRDESAQVDHLILGVGSNTNRFNRMTGETLDPRVVAGNAMDPLPPQTIAIYAGRYVVDLNGEDVALEVYGADGRLMAIIGGRTVTRLLPRGEHEFAPSSDPGDRIAFVVEGERAVGVVVTRGGATYRGERRP